MKKKRTVWFGNPMIMVRTQLVPFIVLQTVLVIYFAGMWLNDPENFVDFMTDSLQSAMILVVIPALISFVSALLFCKRLSKYTKRFRDLDGRVCFVCDYEIADGLNTCSECGAVWLLEGLGKGYLKMIGDSGGERENS